VMFLLILGAGVIIGTTAIGLLVRKAYQAFVQSRRAHQTRQSPTSEVSATLNTADSIDNISFGPIKEEDHGFWISLKKYAQIAKTEVPTPDEVELAYPVEVSQLRYCDFGTVQLPLTYCGLNCRRTPQSL
jgi:hypothetical protein